MPIFHWTVLLLRWVTRAARGFPQHAGLRALDHLEPGDRAASHVRPGPHVPPRSSGVRDWAFLGATTAVAYKTESWSICGRHFSPGRRRRSLLTVHLQPYWGQPAIRNFRGGRGNPKLDRARRASLPYLVLLLYPCSRGSPVGCVELAMTHLQFSGVTGTPSWIM